MWRDVNDRRSFDNDAAVKSVVSTDFLSVQRTVVSIFGLNDLLSIKTWREVLRKNFCLVFGVGGAKCLSFLLLSFRPSPLTAFLKLFCPSLGSFIYWSSGRSLTCTARVIDVYLSLAWARHWQKNTDETGRYLTEILWVKNFAGPEIQTHNPVDLALAIYPSFWCPQLAPN